MNKKQDPLPEFDPVDLVVAIVEQPVVLGTGLTSLGLIRDLLDQQPTFLTQLVDSSGLISAAVKSGVSEPVLASLATVVAIPLTIDLVKRMIRLGPAMSWAERNR